MYKRILVAVDLNQDGKDKKTIAAAAALAAHESAELRLIHVRFNVDLALRYVAKDLLDAEEESVTAELTALGKTHTSLPFTVVSPSGSILDRTINEARDFRADLIVVGPHRPSMAKYLIGMNAARIVQHAPVSVLVVR